MEERSLGALKAAIEKALAAKPSPDTSDAEALCAQIEKEESATSNLRNLMNNPDAALGPLSAAVVAKTLKLKR